MYCSNSRGMATLLQQKNCMKTLTNGGVSGGGSSSSGSSTTATASIQQTRMLLPHEMVGIPSSIPISNINTSFTGSTVNCYSQQVYDQTQNQPNQNQQSQQFNTHNQVNNVHQFSRYFPQFNNHDSNTSYMSNNSAINLNTSSHNFLSNAVTNMNTSSSGNTASQNANYHQSSVIIHKQNTVLNQHPPTTSSDTSVAQYIKEEIPENFGNDSANGCQNRNEQKFVSNNETLPNGALGAEEDQEPEPEIDIVINNVVCSFSVRCHLNLREIALNGFNVEFRRENGMVTMKLRRPYTTASIWSSGRITCTGATSEEQAKIAARRYARCLQKLGFSVRFHNFRVVNVLGTCSMPWAIKIVNFSERYKKVASYEPELHPGVTYKLKYPKATLKIFSTGSITVTAGSVAHVQAAIEHIYPLVYEFRKKRTAEELELLRSKQQTTEEEEDEEITHSPSAAKKRKPLGLAENDPREDIMNVSDFEGDEAEAV